MRRKYPEGRDEMNLADFPISALQRRQKVDGEGHKLDRLEFEASRYDPATRRRLRQKVTLTSTARDGLPTPADEHVILALLYVAKHGNNFAGPTVHFAPSQLFDIMGWAPNGRSYTRLRDVLRRLKSLTIRYENAWWDVVGRGYEEEVATGIVSAYRVARQVSGPRTADTPLLSWVTWTPQFHESLQNGNIKRLNLDVFFSLSTPTAQRMYRFLDKRFYTAPALAMDLVEFACGHVGLTDARNVALLKRRLAPAIAELEKIGFIKPLEASERYQKVKPGVWRVVFQSAECPSPPVPLPQGERGEENRAVGEARGSGFQPDRDRLETCPTKQASAPARELAEQFYRAWDPAVPAAPGARDLEQAEALLGEHGAEGAKAVVGWLVRVTRKGWPECRSLSGAVQKYLPDALKLYRQERRRQESQREAERVREQEQQEEAERAREEEERRRAWEALPEGERAAIEARVRERLAGTVAPDAFVRRLCLEELARQSPAGS